METVQHKTIRKILVAEDDFLVSDEIIRQLKKMGFTNILEAYNGQEAFETACREHPDLILMDIQMPELDGLEATERIQEHCPTPIIILTAYETSDLVARASALGVSAYLTKPPKQAEIDRAICIALARFDDMLKLRRLNDELSKALAEVKKLQGILPICANCKKIRDDSGAWNQIEAYIRDHSEANFSHGICPDCMQVLYSDYIPDE